MKRNHGTRNNAPSEVEEFFHACKKNDIDSIKNLTEQYGFTRLNKKKMSVIDAPEMNAVQIVTTPSNEGGTSIARLQPHYKKEQVTLVSTALSTAATHASYEAVEYLLRKGAAVNETITLETMSEFLFNQTNPQYHRDAVKKKSGCEIMEIGIINGTKEPLETNIETMHTALTCAIRGLPNSRKRDKDAQDQIINLLLDHNANAAQKIIACSGRKEKTGAIKSRGITEFRRHTPLHLAIENGIKAKTIARIARKAGYSFEKDDTFKATYKDPRYTPPWQKNCALLYLSALLIIPIIVQEIFRKFPERSFTPKERAEYLYKKTDPEYYQEILSALKGERLEAKPKARRKSEGASSNSGSSSGSGSSSDYSSDDDSRDNFTHAASNTDENSSRDDYARHSTRVQSTMFPAPPPLERRQMGARNNYTRSFK